MGDRVRVIILAATLVVVAAAFAILGGRLRRPAECRRDIEGLLLASREFPTGWTRGTPFQDDEFRVGALDSCDVSYYVQNGVANYLVNAYRDEQAAARGFEILARSIRFDEDVTSPIQAPQEPVGADAALVECGRPRVTHLCQYLAQYGRDVVWLTTHINPAFMTEAEFLDLVGAIDKQMRSLP